jgi:hypothetical protein
MSDRMEKTRATLLHFDPSRISINPALAEVEEWETRQAALLESELEWQRRGDRAIKAETELAETREARDRFYYLKEQAEAERDRLREALEEVQRQFSLWESSRMDEMGLDSEGTLVQISDDVRAALGEQT